VKQRYLILLSCLLFSPSLLAQGFSEQQQKDIAAFTDRMVSEHQFTQPELEQLFSRVEHKPGIIEAITRPAEAKPWFRYRPIFLTEQRINGGLEFWREHAPLLARAEKEYGVPAQIIVAIIGVETFYGRHKGNYRVIDALSTLGFGYPPRGKFFSGELEHFLLMAREEKREPLEFVGSYAGAMGMPQFIPSSFRAYAVDFDGDGKRDLWDNHADIIGSVANYFSRHHWRDSEPVADRLTLKNGAPKALLDKGLQPAITQVELKASGITPPTPLNKDEAAALLALDSEEGKQEYWLTRHNFYVITRYNRSPLYAMAVYQLSEAIRTSRAANPRPGPEANAPG
jgi:membrane-bound lytic murein transglycosylase B